MNTIGGHNPLNSKPSPAAEDANRLKIETFHAQFGEDRILDSHFSGRAKGYFVEVGAYDGVEYSNTLYFEKKGWTGLLVEADPELAEKARVSRPESVVANCAVVPPGTAESVEFEIVEGHRGLSGLSVRMDFVLDLTGRSSEEIITRKIRVPTRTLDSLLEENRFPQLDYITIDVEGHEWGVLQGFTILRWNPEIVIVERNLPIPESRIMSYMHRNGYRYIRTTGANDWFAKGSDGIGYRFHIWKKLYLPFHLRQLRESTKRILRSVGLRK
jgi:FkbM family methyltransferase